MPTKEQIAEFIEYFKGTICYFQAKGFNTNLPPNVQLVLDWLSQEVKTNE